MSELKYGVNVENLLYDLSQHESDDIGEFDFYCEDEHGREGTATIDITLLASDALKLIAELKAQRDALAAENATLKILAEACSREYESPKTESCEDDEKVAFPEDECNITFGMIRSSNRTPATDAYLNSVRAEIVKELYSEQKEWALHTWQYDNFEALKRAAVRHGDSELSGVIFMLDRIEGFAAKLRAGEPS